MDIPKEINVHIGEVRVAKHGETLRTFLGSCVGIAFIWKSRGICGLAHCLLAKSPAKTFSVGGRYVDQAITSLVVLMKIHPENIQEVEVILVGGGNMTHPGAENPDELVGSHNFNAAEKEIKRRGFKIVCADRADEEGRRITVRSGENTYSIEAIPRSAKAA